MYEDRDMYELEYPAPAINSSSPRGPVMVIALQGYADAGAAVDALADHLKAALESHVLVSFNTDELVDYRSRRPAVTIGDNSIDQVEDITLDLRVLRDTKGESFLLLSGPEPDLRWSAFTSAVADLAEKYNVSSTICVYGAPMTVPHTRPLVVSAHGNDPELIAKQFTIDSRLVVPGAASLYIERELHERGRKVMGLTAHVPHYVASWPYPQATYQLLRSIEQSTGLDLPLRSLEHDSERTAHRLASYLADNQEVQQVVASLEEQYDEELDRYRAAHPNATLPGEAALPSGEELGEEFERFLARLDDQSLNQPPQQSAEEPERLSADDERPDEG